MPPTDPRQAAELFGALYARWDGAIPCDDLSPYQAWYRSLGAHDRRVFRRQVAAHLIGPIGGHNHLAVHRIVRDIDDWFPLDA